MLRADAQRPIEASRRVLPRDHFGELDDLVVVELRSDALEQRQRHVVRRHRVRVGERCSRRGIEQGDLLVGRRVGVEPTASNVDDRAQLLVGDTVLAANCSVDVLSENAPDE